MEWSSSQPSIHVHRIPDRRVVLLGALHRFLEAFVEDAGAVFLTGHLAVELFLHLALLRLQAGHHRLQRAARAPFLHLVQQNFAGGAVDDERGVAAGTGDFDVGSHGGDCSADGSSAGPPAARWRIALRAAEPAAVQPASRRRYDESACVKSSTRSSASSNPTETRSRFSAVRLPAPSLEARCSIRLSVPPR